MPYSYLRKLSNSKPVTVQRLLLVLFIISIAWDMDLLFSKVLMAKGMMNPQTWEKSLHFLVAVGEVIAVVGATLFWLAMLGFCLTYSKSNLRRLFWIIGFMVTVWWGAQFYYIFVYRRRREDMLAGEFHYDTY